MNKRNLTKKIKAVGIASLLIATPFAAYADNHVDVNMSADSQTNITDLEEQISDLDVGVIVNVDVEYDSEEVEVSQEILDLIESLRESLENVESETEIEIKSENKDGEVETEVETEGSFSTEQENIINSIVQNVEELLASTEDSKFELKIEAEVESAQDDNDDDSDNLGDLDWRTEIESDFEGVEVSDEITSRLQNFEESLSSYNQELEFKLEVESENGQVETDFREEGEISSELSNLWSNLQEEVLNLVNSSESQEIKVNIEIERSYHSDDDSSDDTDSGDGVDDSDNLSNLDWRTEIESEFEGVEVSDEITSILQNFEESLSSYNQEVEFELEVESENGQVETDFREEGEISVELSNLWSDLQEEVLNLVNSSESQEIKVKIEIERSYHSDDDLGEVEEEREITNDEVKLLRDVTGAQVRVLQLQNRVELQIMNAQDILDYLIEQEIEADIESMSAIVVEFGSLNESLSEIEYNQSARVLAQTFVDYKSEAITLTDEFRSHVRAANLTSSQIQDIQILVSENRDEHRDETKDRVRNAIKSYNVGKLDNLLERVGFENSETVIQAYLNGEVTLDEIQTRVRAHINSLDDESETRVRAEIREQRTRVEIESRQRAQEIRTEYREVRENNREEVRQRLDNVEERIEQRLRERYEELNSTQREMVRRGLENLNEEERQRLFEEVSANGSLNVRSSVRGER